MEMQINVNTKIIYMDSAVPVMRAIENVKRDIRKVCCDSDEKGCDIVLIMENMQAEQFEIKCDNNMLVIYASDTLGFVYGLYHISRDILGVLPFWFWNDQVFIKKKGCRISGEYAYTSKPYAVKYRGWFVNDEVLIHKWYVDRKKDMPWEMVFEALLRCGGNLVIPGTDKNSHIYRDLAADMGLRITHHHAEPLGAPMFARRYPELTPSYDEYPEKFHELWKEGIDEQKKLDVIWNLGFRGQGDCPFWDNDPRYQTSESRGELMGKLIGLQRDYVQNEIPDAQYCTNLYGETMELYRDGYLKLPDDVIKIWADNGFGKMVTRRQGNHNPRIPALPKENNTGRHGIYYHVSFYDLQAANHITMLPNKPKLVHSELKKVLEHHVKDYWIINCSNVKPHVYYLDFIANMWRDGDVDIDKHLKGYIASYYGEDHITEIAECFRQYWQHALKYGEHEDDHAGEQFANHVARMLISQFMKDKSQRAEDLLWACDDKTLEGQVEWYKKLCAKGKESYEQLLCCYEKLDARLIDHERILFEDSLYLQAEIYYNCYSGALLMCEALCEAFAGEYKLAFYKAGKARKAYLVPQYIVLKKLNLIDTRIALILPWFFGAAFFIFMLVQFFRGVPKELDEAAEIDGCGRIAILFRILAPVVKPSIITASIFAFYWIWQDFFQPLIFMSTTSKFTLSLALNMFLDPSTYNNYGGLFAMSVLSLLPTIIFFIIFQRYLVDGIAMDGIKG